MKDHQGLTDLDNDEYQREFSRLCQYTKRTKFRDFQYYLLLGKIITVGFVKFHTYQNFQCCLICCLMLI